MERIARRWTTVAAIAVLGAAAACVYTFLRRPEYAGHVSIFFPAKSSVLGSNALVDSPANGVAAALTGGGSPNPLRVYEAFLGSETAVREIVTANGLKREVFLGKRILEDDPRANVLNVTYQDYDRTRNLAVLQWHVQELARINRKVSFDSSADDLAVLRRRLANMQAQMKRSEADLVEYQRSLISAPSINSSSNGGITSTPATWASELVRLRIEQARVENSLAAAKERTRMLAALPRDIPTELPPVKRLAPALQQAEYQLATKRLTLGPDAPDIRHLEANITALRSQMEKEIRAYLQGVNGGIIDPSVDVGALPQLITQKTSIAAQIAVVSRLASVAPDESIKLNRRFRELALQGSVLQQLTTQVFQASLQAQRNPNRWVVLDDPWIEEKPINKSYTRMSLSGGLAGAIVGCLLVLGRRERRR